MLEAEGCTRRAGITGAYRALLLACQRLMKIGTVNAMPLTDEVAAVASGIFAGAAVLDLDYDEDSNAEADANFVLTGSGGIVEVQGTAEQKPFSQDAFLEPLALAVKGARELF